MSKQVVTYNSQELPDDKQNVCSYFASETIVEGSSVFWDTSKQGAEKTSWVVLTPAGSKSYCGIAVSSATAGQSILIMHSGYYANAIVHNVHGGEPVAVGQPLVVDDTHDGILTGITSNHGRDHQRSAVALTTVVNDRAEVWLFPTY